MCIHIKTLVHAALGCQDPPCWKKKNKNEAIIQNTLVIDKNPSYGPFHQCCEYIFYKMTHHMNVTLKNVYVSLSHKCLSSHNYCGHPLCSVMCKHILSWLLDACWLLVMHTTDLWTLSCSRWTQQQWRLTPAPVLQLQWQSYSSQAQAWRGLWKQHVTSRMMCEVILYNGNTYDLCLNIETLGPKEHLGPVEALYIWAVLPE